MLIGLLIPEAVLTIGAAVGAAGLVALLLGIHIVAARGLLDRWAAREGYEVLYAHSCWIFRGPFWFSGRGQVVFQVVVRDGSGERRTGHVRVGGMLLGLLSDHVEAIWE